jgi:hypothetical protein
MSSAVQLGSLPSDVPAATPEGVFLVHNRACSLPPQGGTPLLTNIHFTFVPPTVGCWT